MSSSCFMYMYKVGRTGTSILKSPAPSSDPQTILTSLTSLTALPRPAPPHSTPQPLRKRRQPPPRTVRDRRIVHLRAISLGHFLPVCLPNTRLLSLKRKSKRATHPPTRQRERDDRPCLPSDVAHHPLVRFRTDEWWTEVSGPAAHLDG